MRNITLSVASVSLITESFKHVFCGAREREPAVNCIRRNRATLEIFDHRQEINLASALREPVMKKIDRVDPFAITPKAR